MAINAKLALSTSLKITEGTEQVAARAVSGSIDIDEHVEYIDTLAPSTTDKNYNIDELAQADVIYIEFDRDISLKLDSTGNDPILLKKSVTSGTESKGVFLMTGSGTTAIYLSNADTTTSAKVKLIVGTYGTA